MAGFSHTIGNTLKSLAKEKSISVLVETGTFKGDTAELASKIFKKVYTIEFDPKLYKEARKKFKGNRRVLCLNGDSPMVLKKVIGKLKKTNAIFFLDAHWAGDLASRSTSDTPLKEELVVLLTRTDTQDVIIIDDLSFLGKKGKFFFKPGISKYFPKGGWFKWDWRHINKKDIKNMFKGKRIIEKDDRFIIYL